MITSWGLIRLYEATSLFSGEACGETAVSLAVESVAERPLVELLGQRGWTTSTIDIDIAYLLKVTGLCVYKS